MERSSLLSQRFDPRRVGIRGFREMIYGNASRRVVTARIILPDWRSTRFIPSVQGGVRARMYTVEKVSIAEREKEREREILLRGNNTISDGEGIRDQFEEEYSFNPRFIRPRRSITSQMTRETYGNFTFVYVIWIFHCCGFSCSKIFYDFYASVFFKKKPVLYFGTCSVHRLHFGKEQRNFSRI